MTTLTLDPVVTEPSSDRDDTSTREAREAAIVLAIEAGIPAQSDASILKSGATTFTADPGPAVSAIGRLYAIDATADAVAVSGKATGNNPNGIGVWGEAPLIAVAGNGAGDGCGVFGQGLFGVMGVLGPRKDGAAVSANGSGGIGVDAIGSTFAVIAHADDPAGIAVDASGGQRAVRASSAGIGIETNGSTGMYASGNGQKGVGVDASGGMIGVRGASVSGIGIKATGATGLNAEGAGASGVGVVANGATGLIATSFSPTGVGVAGNCEKGIGVRGQSDQGTGVLGFSELGLGGDFGGTRAPIRLRPNEAAQAPPKGGEVGELFVDNKGTLYFCTQGGIWKTVVLK
jgi:hypothetical protein